jgi:AraC-like DNA-binding protein
MFIRNSRLIYLEHNFSKGRVRISFFGIDSFQIAAIAKWPLVTRLLGEPLELFVRYVVEKYRNRATEKPEFHRRLPIRQLPKVEDHVREHLAEDISVDGLAEVVELSPFHFWDLLQMVARLTPRARCTIQRKGGYQSFRARRTGP